MAVNGQQDVVERKRRSGEEFSGEVMRSAGVLNREDGRRVCGQHSRIHETRDRGEIGGSLGAGRIGWLGQERRGCTYEATTYSDSKVVHTNITTDNKPTQYHESIC
jgi:hypothetical protein